MRITELLSWESIELRAGPADKKEALDMAIRLMEKSGKISDVESYRKQVYAREEEGTTGIGEGIAIPHGKGDGVKAPGLAAMVIPDGVDFDSLDGKPVHLIFLIAAPNTKENVHLEVLSKLSVLLMDQDFVWRLRCATNRDEFINIINVADRKTKAEEAKKAEPVAVEEVILRGNVLAVTSCPTGIAHTYMAAEGLEKAARAKGCAIKVETRGSGGAKNVLTEKEIEEADCIIVAADAKVPMERFVGKPVIECQVSDGISKAEQLIDRALSGEVSPYRVGQPRSNSFAETKKEREDYREKGASIGHKIYTHLMNGVSHMLPFVVGGGILIALAFLIDSLSVDMETLPADIRANFGSITSAAAVLKGIGDAAFGFMLPILAGFIAASIGDRPGLAVGFVGGFIAANGKSGFLGALAAGFIAGYLIAGLRKLFEKLPEIVEKLAPVLLYPFFGILLIGLIMTFLIEPPIGTLNTALNDALTRMGGSSKVLLGAVVAGMMAIDMGGPFNKAAYVFGTASIVAGNYDIMAAVMVGGMVPPCAIALATLIFRNKFTKEQRESGPANFIMGLAFITEGAIPFAASDPLRVLPSCILGSAVAGAMSMLFGCTLMAPHGGIFVFPVVENPLMYLVSLIVGTVVAAFVLGLLKKKLEGDYYEAT
ncbi:MAG: PTS sugar transporter subunit IIA [Lachnospiraceae bacterium]|nr:PTS sugar transporter subunit IIA [Lachnospiraceae bacterium]